MSERYIFIISSITITLTNKCMNVTATTKKLLPNELDRVAYISWIRWSKE